MATCRSLTGSAAMEEEKRRRLNPRLGFGEADVDEQDEQGKPMKGIGWLGDPRREPLTRGTASPCLPVPNNIPLPPYIAGCLPYQLEKFIKNHQNATNWNLKSKLHMMTMKKKSEQMMPHSSNCSRVHSQYPPSHGDLTATATTDVYATGRHH
uniref:Uncharacterized protein n=1 Tax=Oryza punctata TaxID=4537 RepID=A0A0E0LIK5_ORYPU